ncbi:glycine-rich domain-containing protein [Streptomyces sp. KR80]|uniref:glycine-rich domain-containing protein n=1 Tax=Streptomyces sp. KR80 TaxID=3457426 RepID=UPI003FD0916E
MSIPGPDPDPIPSARALLAEQQFTSARSTVMDANPGMPEDMAGRIVEEGIKFVVACARFPGVGLAPSRIVDEGWHALLLHSELYADLCARFGEFVHHYPGWDPTHYDPPILERTRTMIGECGYTPDEELWGHPTEGMLVSVAANCQHAPECTIQPMPEPRDPRG